MDDRQRELAEKNHNLIYGFLNHHHLSADEYYDIAAIGLCYAAERYNGKDSAFSTYAYRCMLSMVQHEMRRRKNQSQQPPGGYVLSLEREIIHANGETERLMDRIPGGGETEAETVDACYYGAILKRTLARMNDRNQEIIKMLIAGYRQDEVAKIYGFSRQNVFVIKKKFLRLWKQEEKKRGL